MKTFVLMFFLMCGLLWYATAPAHADSPQLDALATQLAGKPVTVSCFAPDDVYQGYVNAVSYNLGITWEFDTVIHLDGEQCGALQNILTPGPTTLRWLHTRQGNYRTGNALLTLTHEATHIALASVDEALVECTAYHNVYNAARLLPLSWKDRNAVAASAQQTHTDYDVPEYRTVC